MWPFGLYMAFTGTVIFYIVIFSIPWIFIVSLLMGGQVVIKSPSALQYCAIHL